MDKSPEAFRTISEVAEALETPAHVLRFWESRFPQIRPVKRAGGRRYYRPADVALLTGIKRLLHDEGMTIRGVQRILREQGIRHVSGLADETSPEEAELDQAMAARFDDEPAVTRRAAADKTASVLRAALDSASARGAASVTPLHPPRDATPEAPAPEATAPKEAAAAPEVPPQQDTPAAAPAPDPVPLPDPAPAPRAARRGTDPHQPGLPFDAPPPAAAPEDPPEEVATATLAARLRALPRGSLARRREPLVELAARIAELRARLAGQPPQPRG